MSAILSNSLLIALLLTAIAGFSGGIYTAPKKLITAWAEENTWFLFFFFSCFLLPLSTIFLIAPGILETLQKIPTSILMILIMGGFFFGIGQILFALAFKLIGVGINFVINISIATALTALIGLTQTPSLIFTQYGTLQIIGVLAFLVAVSLSTIAGITKHRNKKATHIKTTRKELLLTVLGIILSIFAGIGSTCEGASYAICNSTVSEIAKSLGYSTFAANVLSWVIIFVPATIPNSIYFFFLMIKNNSLKNYYSKKSFIYCLYIVLMSSLYWFPLVLFAIICIIIGGNLAPTIAWPLFMVFIILASNSQSFLHGEWKGANTGAIIKIWISILIFICAISLFSYSAIIKNNISTPNSAETLTVHN